tara:strand:- start:5197 stop:5622 length:426 start_codon:yes stop_codon:yes gene_type:complete
MPKEITAGVREAVKDSSQAIYIDAQAGVSRDSGDLGAALSVRIRGDKLGAAVGYWKKGNKRKWALAGWRAHFTEFGTRGYAAGDTRRSKNSKTTSKIKRKIPARKARPFLGPAFKVNRKFIKRRMTKAVNHALDRAARYGR